MYTNTLSVLLVGVLTLAPMSAYSKLDTDSLKIEYALIIEQKRQSGVESPLLDFSIVCNDRLQAHKLYSIMENATHQKYIPAVKSCAQLESGYSRAYIVDNWGEASLYFVDPYIGVDRFYWVPSGHSAATKKFGYMCFKALASEQVARQYRGLPANSENVRNFGKALTQKYDLNREEVLEALEDDDLFATMLTLEEQESAFLVYTLCSGTFEQFTGYKLR